MRSAPHIFNEDARLAALAKYDLLGKDARIDLDDVVQLATALFDVPIVLIPVVDVPIVLISVVER